MHYVLEEQEILEAINNIMDEPKSDKENVNQAQHRCDMAAYTSWKKKDSTKFGRTTASKLRQLTIKFDTFKKVPNKSMKQHLRDNVEHDNRVEVSWTCTHR
ncbi:conserved hypothetical protein [Ricinus communis]|uniref:Uncharacterized protein n=1 Tax=Ricinus communis TaxID=3988 RepID=B9RHR2_RICCO|nr:conserved hypothetical protein [Ricinus communis]